MACGQISELHALSITNLAIQRAFSCWDAAVSPNRKQEEARTTVEINGLSASRTDAWLSSAPPWMPAAPPIPPDLTHVSVFNTCFSLHLRWRISPSEEASTAISSKTPMLLRFTFAMHCSTLARRGPGQMEVAPNRARGGQWAETHHCYHDVVSSGFTCHLLFPVCVDGPDSPDHPISSAGVSHGWLTGVRWLGTTS